jgi:NAD(P)H-hydrate epimerase
MQENIPDLWRHLIPEKKRDSNKYDHGYAVIYGAEELTGATRLTASACARMGVGLVTVLTKPEQAAIYRSSLPAHIMVREELDWNHKAIAVRIYGPGGLPVKPHYKSKIPTILDAAALNNLPEKLSENFILTPHDGEFEKSFPDIKGTREEKAVKAAKKINAHIVLKGSETIIACPNGKHIVSRHAPPLLATAGTGDVLSGIIGGLVGQKMDIFQACNAAVWIHGECAYKFGKGLVAEDLIDMIPSVLQNL